MKKLFVNPHFMKDEYSRARDKDVVCIILIPYVICRMIGRPVWNK
jgi:hypothetical protein